MVVRKALKLKNIILMMGLKATSFMSHLKTTDRDRVCAALPETTWFLSWICLEIISQEHICIGLAEVTRIHSLLSASENCVMSLRDMQGSTAPESYIFILHQ